MLNEFLEDYQEFNEDEALDDFLDLLWGSKYEMKTYSKRYTFFIDEKLLNNNEELIELFKPYRNIKIRYAKSYFKDKPSSIDMIRIHINNMYMYLTYKDVYLGKPYYDEIFKYRKLYFKTIDNIKQRLDLNAEDIKKELELITENLETIKNERLQKKIDLAFDDYKELINGYVFRLFNNYKPPHVYEEEFGWELENEFSGWTEDNYIVKYFCKSLTGYMQHYIRSINVQKKICQKCEKEMIVTSNRQIICLECRNKKFYEKECIICKGYFSTNYKQQICCKKCKNIKEKKRKLKNWHKFKSNYRNGAS